MKKLLVSALSVILLLSVFAVPALAFDSEAFWEQNGAALAAKGVHQYGEHAFQEGLMPVLVKNTWGYRPYADGSGYVPETVWNYINEKLEVVDLNQGRFDYMFPFYDGLAAVANDDGVGYIDKTGKLVIPCQYGTYSGMGQVWVGYFHEGKATVLKESYAMQQQVDANGVPSFSPSQWEVGTIDKTGKLVEAYHTVEGMSAGLHMVVDYGATSDGASEPEPEPAKSGVQISFTKSDGWMEVGIPYYYTITNHTDQPVNGAYALLSYAPRRWRWGSHEHFSAQLHSFDVVLQPGEIMSESLISGITGLSNLKLVWIAFESAEERAAFLADSSLREDYGRYDVEDEQWLKDKFNITLLPAQ